MRVCVCVCEGGGGGYVVRVVVLLALIPQRVGLLHVLISVGPDTNATIAFSPIRLPLVPSVWTAIVPVFLLLSWLEYIMFQWW